jgi:hypothetical protein
VLRKGEVRKAGSPERQAGGVLPGAGEEVPREHEEALVREVKAWAGAAERLPQRL